MKRSTRWLMLLFSLFIFNFVGGIHSESVTPEEAKLLRDEVRQMFYHAFDGYMEHAFPLDELRPLSCSRENTLGVYVITLVDTLDTLALFGDKERFTAVVDWISKNIRFDINKTVSVFETNIRILGGLLSAHLIARDYATGMKIPTYDNQLLKLAEDLSRRMLPAFDTPTCAFFVENKNLIGTAKYASINTLTLALSEDEGMIWSLLVMFSCISYVAVSLGRA